MSSGWLFFENKEIKEGGEEVTKQQKKYYEGNLNYYLEELQLRKKIMQTTPISDARDANLNP